MPLPNNWGGIPDMNDLVNWEVNRRGEFEGIRQSLYDIQTYAQAGQTVLTFFQVPIGQGGKTLDDTNMEIAGSLPTPKNFLIQSIEIYTEINLDIFTKDIEEATNIVPPEYANDVKDMLEGGNLQLFIGSKNYLTEAPLMRFPQKARMQSDHALAGNMHQLGAASDKMAMGFSDYTVAVGRPYTLAPPIRLIPTQNFNVTLNWNAAKAISKAARIGIFLDGIMYRESQ